MGACATCCCAMNDGLENCFKEIALSCGRFFKIEDLTRNAVLEEDKVLTNLQGSAIIALMRES